MWNECVTNHAKVIGFVTATTYSYLCIQIEYMYYNLIKITIFMMISSKNIDRDEQRI